MYNLPYTLKSVFCEEISIRVYNGRVDPLDKPLKIAEAEIGLNNLGYLSFDL